MMSEWILLIALGGFINVGGVQVHRDLTESQCRGALNAFRPLDGKIGVACISPDGAVINNERERP